MGVLLSDFEVKFYSLYLIKPKNVIKNIITNLIGLLKDSHKNRPADIDTDT